MELQTMHRNNKTFT